MRYINLLLILFLITSIGWVQEEKEQSKIFRATIDSDGIQRIEILGGNYFFEPNHIIVKINIPVEIKIRKKAGIVPHNIVIKAPEVGIDIREEIGTDPKLIKFIPTKVGKYSFYCDKKLLFFKNHRGKGMEGILEVIE